MSHAVPIRKLSSGVPGFDDVLGGGIPELSLNLIVGSAGSGKTTLGHQIMFANATPEAPALFFTVLGEPPIKMLRYQQQFSFFDASKVGGAIRFINLGEEAQADDGLTTVLDAIVREVERSTPRLVVVDSFRAVVRRTRIAPTGEMDVQDFMQRLAVHLTSCEATTFMLGEYGDGEQDSSLFTVADGIVRLSQAVERNSVVRKLQVVKMRGQGQIPGLQTMRLTEAGVTVYPRILKPDEGSGPESPFAHRLTTGVPVLDEMMGGGIPRGYSVLIAGPSGSGKTVLSNEFIVGGIEKGEPGVIAVFEKRPNEYLHTTPRGSDFQRFVEQKKLEVVYLRPLDLSIDETLTALREAVLRIGAKRAVIDSLSGLELALAPTFREDFRESLYRMVGALTGMGVTVVSTVELPDSFTSLPFSPHGTAFLSDAIIMQRYIELEGQLRRALAVVKVRGSQHSKDMREYEVDSKGMIVVGEPLRTYEGLLTGAPTLSEKNHVPRKADPT
jgi:circadian clock protein KaiC